jgi:nuclear autoantigenic sperm protein
MALHYILSNDKFTPLLSPRIALYGELSPECASTYYQYGRALLKKAQKAANHFSVPKNPPYEKTVEGTTSGSDTGNSDNSGSKEGIDSSIYANTFI